jgi:putative ABC transport system ATP-binding protein
VTGVVLPGSTGDGSRGVNGDVAAAAQQPDAIPVFDARGLSKINGMGEADVHALRDVDLDIFEREFIVLLGPSGSGKSML